MLWQVVFFILLCAVFFELADNTRSEAAVVFWRGEEHNWFTILRAMCVCWPPLFLLCSHSYRPLSLERHNEQ